MVICKPAVELTTCTHTYIYNGDEDINHTLQDSIVPCLFFFVFEVFALFVYYADLVDCGTFLFALLGWNTKGKIKKVISRIALILANHSTAVN